VVGHTVWGGVAMGLVFALVLLVVPLGYVVFDNMKG
jgi:uncharacterized membrane protein YukC